MLKIPKGFWILLISCSLLTVAAVAIVPAITHMNLYTFFLSIGTQTITTEELQKDEYKSAIFVDVRTIEEHQEERIPKSILIPITDIEMGKGTEKLATIAVNNNMKDKPIILYCQSGARSIKAYKSLTDLQLNFYVLAGGIDAWKKAGGKII